MNVKIIFFNFFRFNLLGKNNELLHYYKFENTANLFDEMTSTSISLAGFSDPEDQGLNIADSEFDMENLKASMNLIQCKD